MAKIPANASEKTILAYLGKFKGTVTAAWVKANPTLQGLQGKTAVDVYQALKAANPGKSPYTIAQAITEIWIGGSLSGILKDLVVNLGAATAATAKGVTTGIQVPSWATGLTSFLGALTSGQLWIRVGEGVLGIILIAVGLARITHAVPPVTAIARTVGAVA